MTDSTPPKEAEKPWHAALPAPRSTPKTITAEDLMKLFDDMDLTTAHRNWLLVDVRRVDWEGGTIKTSLNLPAQSFYQSRKTLLDLCDRASVNTVIFYCGSSQGRGPRCAGWFQDYIDDVARFGRKTAVKSLVLEGGIKGWVKEWEGGMMEGFVEEVWK